MNFAIIGASGNVGRKTIEILEKSKIKLDNLFLVASSKSAGKKIKFRNKEIKIGGNQSLLEKISELIRYVESFSIHLEIILPKEYMCSQLKL